MKRVLLFGFGAALFSAATAVGGDHGSWMQLSSPNGYSGWTTYRGEPVQDPWIVEDGAYHLKNGGGGDIMTEQDYGDFELEFEWKVAEGANSGVMYLVRKGDDAPYYSGPEYQILDDAKHRDGQNAVTSAGSLYALVAPEGKELKPVGEWNSARIVLQNKRLEHWLNGKKVVEIEVGSESWNQLVAGSKFAEWAQFAKADRGHIVLQDHGDPVWYRNIRIRSLAHQATTADQANPQELHAMPAEPLASSGGCGCGSEAAPASSPCGCGTEVAAEPSAPCGCGTETAAATPSTPCGCGEEATVAAEPSTPCGCGTEVATAPSSSCGCDAQESVSSPAPCGCGTDTATPAEHPEAAPKPDDVEPSDATPAAEEAPLAPEPQAEPAPSAYTPEPYCPSCRKSAGNTGSWTPIRMRR